MGPFSELFPEVQVYHRKAPDFARVSGTKAMLLHDCFLTVNRLPALPWNRLTAVEEHGFGCALQASQGFGLQPR
jgi:hypothetical protein